MSKKKVIILGAGLAGLSAAWHLQKKGQDCLVFEKESEVGGLCRSKNIKGFTFDYDGHLLHFKNRYVFGLVKDLLKGNLVRHKRSSWVYSHNRYIRYPFQANLYGLPKPIVKECLLGFLEASQNGHGKKKNPNFLEWIKQTFGPGISRHFMLPYNQKFWTIPLSELTCDWLDGFIPVPSISEAIEGTLEESKRQFGYNAYFWYPKKGGIEELALAFTERIKNIQVDCPAIEVDLTKKEIKTPAGREKYDYLISTLPLPEMFNLIKTMPQQTRSLFKKLRWNSIFNLNLGIERKNNHSRHWVYFPQKEFSFFRVGFAHNFSSYPAPKNKSSLYVEVSYSQDKKINKNSVIASIKKGLNDAGVLNSQDNILIEDTNDIKYGYPIYDKNYAITRKGILSFLHKNNIIGCGRYGSWRYLSMESSILDGIRAAEEANAKI